MHTETKNRINSAALLQKRDAAPCTVEAQGAAHRGAIEKTPEGAEEAGNNRVFTSGGSLCGFRCGVVFRDGFRARLPPVQQFVTGYTAIGQALDLLRIRRFAGPFGAGKSALTLPAAQCLVCQTERFCHRRKTDVPDGVFEG